MCNTSGIIVHKGTEKQMAGDGVGEARIFLVIETPHCDDRKSGLRV